MSKGSKKQFKQFEMTSIEEACLIMRGLLVPVITDIGKFKRYSQEAIELLDKCDVVASVPGEEYDSIHDKLLYQQRELLRFLADKQSSSFSYIMVRPIMEKRGFLKRALEQDKLEIRLSVLVSTTLDVVIVSKETDISRCILASKGRCQKCPRRKL